MSSPAGLAGLLSPIQDGGREGAAGAARERSGRRRRVYGYLKAADELRQTYSARLAQKYQDAYDERIVGGIPDVEPVMYGNEEMVLFPTYGRRHVKTQPQDRVPALLDESAKSDAPSQDPDDWQRELDKQAAAADEDTAIVDIDVRGWVYSPHQGPLGRKNRILMSIARRLSGIPAPDPASAGDSDSDLSRTDDVLANKEANAIPEDNLDSSSKLLKPDYGLSQAELAAANAELMERLSPFLTNPLAGLHTTIFFFNDKQSQSTTVPTNAGGHFYTRMALDFVPTHVRVLAGEHLSAMSEIKLLEPRGVSLISDIDDTIKHSSIVRGTKEMFRNTFVRNLEDLTVLGVNEWYTRLADAGVGIHYVSNSPWQLYPLLKRFFRLAGLPPGSFHLREYPGVIQSLFEPKSEGKRPTLERVMQDFPERRFVLVGDSGEADLEVYTELVLANPGRILAIFIRDVTTLDSSRFFDKSVSHLERAVSRAANRNGPADTDSSDSAEQRPSLPPRRTAQQTPVPVGQLIDFDSDDNSVMPSTSEPKQAPPPSPPKPPNLRGISTGNMEPNGKDRPSQPSIQRKAVPPVPYKPRRLSSAKIVQPSRPIEAAREQNLTRSSSTPVQEPILCRPTLDRVDHLRSAPASVASPSERTKRPPPVAAPHRSVTSTLATTATTSIASSSTTSSPTPSRQSAQNFRPSTSASTISYAQHQSSRLTPPRAQTPPSSLNSFPMLSDPDSSVPLNKREEMWKRRWVRAQEILDDHGVILATWRVGSDMQDLCERVVARAMKDEEQAWAASTGA
jgi:phosphatidate phosphatase APP1